MDGKRILLIISGGIAAYKSLDLIRRLQDQGASVRAILTKGGAEFITPLAVSSLTGDKTYTDLFSLTDETEMGHIRLSREADLVIVAPATADLMAKMANGLANDLASTTLLATDKPVMVCPAMNVEMWTKPATQRNVETLKSDGVIMVGPVAGDLACGEVGEGRLSDVPDILKAVTTFFLSNPKANEKALPLAGKRAVVTAGPTHEAIDPVRYIANRSSGKQGYAIAASLANAGADVTLISGPTSISPPSNVTFVTVTSAKTMYKAILTALERKQTIAVCVAAVSDWRVEKEFSQKIKKDNGEIPDLKLVENPDILKAISNHDNRPKLVVGFAAETNDLIENAQLKLVRKGCDWIVANDVSQGSDVMGGDNNQVTIVTPKGEQNFGPASKTDIATGLVQKMIEDLV
jgi:phosphopantothenoylcysteine decarboxylase/phosphopantothenate--cysteine ligase